MERHGAASELLQIFPGLKQKHVKLFLLKLSFIKLLSTLLLSNEDLYCLLGNGVILKRVEGG